MNLRLMVSAVRISRDTAWNLQLSMRRALMIVGAGIAAVTPLPGMG